MNQIIPEVVKTSQLVHQISISTLEQNAGFSQINNAIQQLSQVIQQNASVYEELAASAEELSFQASKLKESINFFKINKRYSELKNELEIKM